MRSKTESNFDLAVLYLAFAGTGVGVALPGALLPALLVRWHLGDEQGGRLFLLAWIGSSAGALLVRGSLRTVLLLGSLAIAAGAAGLGSSGGFAADAWIGLYGVGLGMTMTAISLLRQQQAERTGAEMVRLNLVWAIGACLAPSLTVRALAEVVIQPLLLALGGCFLLLAGWAALHPEMRLLPPLEGKASALRVFREVPAGLIAMTMLITGVEASAGGWLATYARRSGHGLADTIAAPTCLWAGLLVSRLLWSLRSRDSAASVVRGSLVLMGVASLGLIASGLGTLGLLSVFLLGFGIGPTYPLLLSWALRFDRGGAIFFLAGVGSAFLPWLTGAISAERGSLRVGLLVPIVSTMLMIFIAVLGPLKRWSDEAGEMQPPQSSLE